MFAVKTELQILLYLENSMSCELRCKCLLMSHYLSMFLYIAGGANCHCVGYKSFVSQIMWVSLRKCNLYFLLNLLNTPRVKFLSIWTDPKWYPARQSLRLDASASAFFTITTSLIHVDCKRFVTLSQLPCFQRASVSGMRKFCRRFRWEPQPAFTSVTSDPSSHGELWVHTDTQYLWTYNCVACLS